MTLGLSAYKRVTITVVNNNGMVFKLPNEAFTTAPLEDYPVAVVKWCNHHSNAFLATGRTFCSKIARDLIPNSSIAYFSSGNKFASIKKYLDEGMARLLEIRLKGHW